MTKDQRKRQKAATKDFINMLAFHNCKVQVTRDSDAPILVLRAIEDDGKFLIQDSQMVH